MIVCDGYTGNVLLKTAEGAVRLVYEELMHEASRGIFRKLGLGLFRGALKQVFVNKFDYSAYGGAPLLGLNSLAFVLHGSSDSRAVKSAIKFANSFATNGMTQKIIQQLASLEDKLHGGPDSFSDGFAGARNLIRRK